MTDTAQDIMLVEIPVTGTGPNDLTIEDQALIEAELARVNTELKKYTSDVTKFEYVLAVACGIVAGIVDARYTQPIQRKVPETPKTASKVGIAALTRTPDSVGQKTLRELVRSTVPEGIDVNAPMGKLVEDARSVLSKRSTQASVQGLVANVVLLLIAQKGKARGGKVHTPLTDATPDTLVRLIAPATMAGLISWVCKMSPSESDEQEKSTPKAFATLSDLVKRYPILKKIGREAEKWFIDLAAHPERLDKSALSATALTCSLLHHIEKIEEFQGTGISKALALVDGKKTPLPPALTKAMTSSERQAVPVVVMDVLVHTSYFLSRLAHELETGATYRNLDWERIVPYGNRSIDRMVTVASMTLTVVDTADAATCAAIESAGSEIAYAQKFVAHYNFVAAGRCVIAVAHDVKGEVMERQLIREKRALTERHAEIMTARIERYKQELQTRLDSYLAEDLEAFLGGMQMMDEGLMSGDSDKVIAGNVQIQRALNREPQFTNQQEFDLLMESDEDFIL